MSFSVASYNTLATAYIQVAQYRRTPAMVLSSEWRIPALAARVANLAADILCLQEVEPQTFAVLQSRLGALGYASQYARKGSGQPDGCAIFYRRADFELLEARVIIYADGRSAAADSGNVALVTQLRCADGVIGVINTHLTWDPPETSREEQRGHRQIEQLLAQYESMAIATNAWIIAGDLNVRPDSEIVAALGRAGFRYAHRGVTDAHTCNVGGNAKTIDYLFHSSQLRAEPRAVPPITDRTILPSAEEPSDHMPVAANFIWHS